ncbi:hypothetical protein DFP73DRAFT_532063 [Morchella snyderi]|nr:hypothetical protein DFP73DRAFT_532063 [Morchella snyderi]
MDWLTVVSFAIAMLGVVFRAIPIAIAVKQWHRRRSIRGKVPSKDEEDQEMRDIEDEAGAPLELSASIANSHTTQVVNNYYSFHRGHPVAGLRLPAAAFVRPMSATITSPGAEALLHTRVRAATWSGLRDGNASPLVRAPFTFSARVCITVLHAKKRIFCTTNWRLQFAK